jgi:hypothetical protein
MVCFLCALFLSVLGRITPSSIEVVEEIQLPENHKDHCSGLLWKVVVRIQSCRVNDSIYALYYPDPSNTTDPLEPSTWAQCLGEGKIQKLRSPSQRVEPGQLYQLYLYRVRDGVTYKVELFDGELLLQGGMSFTPRMRGCHPFHPKRNLSYGYFTTLVQFIHVHIIYWLDQSGAIVYTLSGFQLFRGMEPTERSEMEGFVFKIYTLLPQPSPEGGKILFFDHCFDCSDTRYCLGNMRGDRLWCKLLRCQGGYHHEVFHDPNTSSILLLGFNEDDISTSPRHRKNIKLPSHHFKGKPSEGCIVSTAFDSSPIVKYDLYKDKFYPVQPLPPITYDNDSSSIVDVVRDFSYQDYPTCGKKTFRYGLEERVTQCGDVFGWDMVHANSIKRALDRSSRLTLSLRNTNQVLLLDEFFHPLYTVGGRARHHRVFHFPIEEDRFVGQHSPWLLSDGTLLLWDNGMASKGYSRALRLVLDEKKMEARKLWQFNVTKFSNQMAECCGSVVMNPSGNILCHDSFPYRRNFFNIYEADGLLNDTPIALVTLHKEHFPIGKWARWKLEYNHIYRSVPVESIDGECVICDFLVPKPTNDQRHELLFITTVVQLFLISLMWRSMGPRRMKFTIGMILFIDLIIFLSL